ncbi:reverse transcriptase domain-containing protein [Tanacetum coccineum]|uniref:Reverse transcriptase domain-containing protein n=1 Tax=Tanacetum coccineum TaxID=301880 RepID=A0ABQ5E0X1_9ASTR
MKIPNVPNTSVKLMLFPFSLEGAARIWLEKEPPRSIETWDDLVTKFINKFFPPSKTTNLRNEITRFQQKFDETFCEAWDRFNDLKGMPHQAFHPEISSDVAELKDMVRALILDRKNQTPASAPVKAVEQSCVTCGGASNFRFWNSSWLSLLQTKGRFKSSDIVCPKRGGFAVVQNEEIELIPNSIGTGWRVYVGNLSRHKYKKSSLDDFTCLWNSFENCLSRLEKMLQRCEGHNLCLNWEKSLFMSKRALTSAIKFLNLGLRLEKPK